MSNRGEKVPTTVETPPEASLKGTGGHRIANPREALPGGVDGRWARPGARPGEDHRTASRKLHYFPTDSNGDFTGPSVCGTYAADVVVVEPRAVSNCRSCHEPVERDCSWCRQEMVWDRAAGGNPPSVCSEKCLKYSKDAQKIENKLLKYSDPTKLLSPDRQKAKRALEDELARLREVQKAWDPEPEKTCQKCGGPFVCDDERRKHCFGCRRAPIVESECIVCGRVMEYHSYDADQDLCPLGIHLFTSRDEAAHIIAKHKMEKKE